LRLLRRQLGPDRVSPRHDAYCNHYGSENNLKIGIAIHQHIRGFQTLPSKFDDSRSRKVAVIVQIIDAPRRDFAWVDFVCGFSRIGGGLSGEAALGSDRGRVREHLQRTECEGHARAAGSFRTAAVDEWGAFYYPDRTEPGHVVS